MGGLKKRGRYGGKGGGNTSLDLDGFRDRDTPLSKHRGSPDPASQSLATLARLPQLLG